MNTLLTNNIRQNVSTRLCHDKIRLIVAQSKKTNVYTIVPPSFVDALYGPLWTHSDIKSYIKPDVTIYMIQANACAIGATDLEFHRCEYIDGKVKYIPLDSRASSSRISSVNKKLFKTVSFVDVITQLWDGVTREEVRTVLYKLEKAFPKVQLLEFNRCYNCSTLPDEQDIETPNWGYADGFDRVTHYNNDGQHIAIHQYNKKNIYTTELYILKTK